jgi:hypothetical protein
MDNSKDDAKRRVRTLPTIANDPTPLVDTYSQNEVAVESQGRFHETQPVVPVDPSFGVRRDLLLKPAKIMRNRAQLSGKQMAMTGGQIGQPRAQLGGRAGGPQKRARR